METLNNLLQAFLHLSNSGKLIIVAALLFFCLFVYYYLPSKEEDSKDAQQTSKAKKAAKEKAIGTEKPKKEKKNVLLLHPLSFFSRKKNAKNLGQEEKDHNKGGYTSFLARKEPQFTANKDNLNETLDIIVDQREDDFKDWTHPPVTEHYSKVIDPIDDDNKSLKELLRKATEASGSPDNINSIFSTMVQAGAINGKKHLVTNFEHQYLEKLRIWFSYRYHIYCQVSVGSALGIDAEVSNLNRQQRLKFAQKCHNMSFDFLLIDKQTDRIFCAIELDDPTHLRPDRQARDQRLNMVCIAADIPLFHITELNQMPNVGKLVTRARRQQTRERKALLKKQGE